MTLDTAAAFSAQTEWLELLPAGAIVCVGDRIHYANANAAAIVEEPSPEALIGASLGQFVHPLDSVRVAARVAYALSAKVQNDVSECRAITRSGRHLVLAINSRFIEVNGTGAVLATFTDMTDRAAMESRLRQSDEDFQRLMATMQDVYYRTDAQGLTRYVCPAVQRVLGYSAEEIVGRSAALFYPDPDERKKLLDAIQRDGFVHDFPGQMTRKDGVVIDISISSHVIKDERGAFAGVEGIWRDISERKKLERQLLKLATSDHLTGVLNRRGVFDFLERSFSRRVQASAADAPFAVLVLDVDHFKQINDTHGHAVGDAVLCALTARISAMCRPEDCFGRVGGEEFVLVLENVDLRQAADIAERVRQTLAATPIKVDDLLVPITVSVGLAEYTEADVRATHVLERGDRALYEAKRLGRNRVVTQLG